jgi:hypothetical protein
MVRLGALSLAAALSACASAPPPSPPAITDADTALILGSGWTGELVYRDYSPPFGEVPLRTTAEVRRIEGGLEIFFRYLDEPSADGPSTYLIAPGGSAIEGEPVLSRTVLANGDVVIETGGPCEDDDLPAMCAHTYTLGETRFSIRKTVDPDGETPAFQRNAYTFAR